MFSLGTYTIKGGIVTKRTLALIDAAYVGLVVLSGLIAILVFQVDYRGSGLRAILGGAVLLYIGIRSIGLKRR